LDYAGEADRSFSIVDDKSPLPPPGASEEEDTVLLQDEVYVDGPVKVDYGTNLRLGRGVYINCKFLNLSKRYCLVQMSPESVLSLWVDDF
jgi:hypothetical protein